MKRLVVASNNKHKIEEIKEMLKKFDFEVVSLKEAGIDIDVEENGTTFLENAEIKARAIKDILENDLVLADDSGLRVDALNGAPGVYSARYAGEHGNDAKNNEKLIKELAGIEFKKRDAEFVCALCLITDENKVIKVEGIVRGKIIENYAGEGGFGYDPLFYIEEHKQTFGQMSSEMKNSMSHRGNALKMLEKELLGVEK